MKSFGKLEKSDLENDFEGVIFKSFDHEEMYEYELFNIEGSKLELVKEYINKINKDEEYYLYYRGDSFKRFGESFDEIVNHSLNKFFIVGFKGIDFYKNERAEGYYDPFDVDKSEYIKKLTDVVRDKFPNFSEDKLEKYSDTKLEVLYSLIHNVGKEKMPEEKEHSPLISVTVGDNNYEVARDFCGIDEHKYGFIILGFEKFGKYSIDSEILKEFNLQNEELIENEKEILIKNALWPSNIIGIFILKNNEKIFIVNPWLLHKFKTRTQRESYLININQENFTKLRKGLSYSQYSARPY